MNRPAARSRSGTPFFCQSSTAETVAQIASSRRLVLYVGAGATITRSGHSWGTLVNVLLQETQMSDLAKDAIRHGYDLPKQASIVRENFRRRYRARASRAIAGILRRELYKAQSWRGGDYADSIALLCREWFGVPRTHRRRDNQFSTSTWNGPSTRSAWTNARRKMSGATRSARSPAPPSHGPTRPSRSSTFTGWFRKTRCCSNDDSLDEIVLDEGDYFRTEDHTAAVLTNLFRDSDVLILGSSLRTHHCCARCGNQEHRSSLGRLSAPEPRHGPRAISSALAQ